MTQPCPPLLKIGEPATVGQVTAVVVENYGRYWQCSQRHRQLADWGK